MNTEEEIKIDFIAEIKKAINKHFQSLTYFNSKFLPTVEQVEKSTSKVEQMCTDIQTFLDFPSMFDLTIAPDFTIHGTADANIMTIQKPLKLDEELNFTNRTTFSFKIEIRGTFNKDSEKLELLELIVSEK